MSAVLAALPGKTARLARIASPHSEHPFATMGFKILP